MSTTKEIKTAEALSTKAAQKELGGDLDEAFQLHVKAAQTFLHLVRTLPDAYTETCRTAAGRSLERAERIKQAKRDVKPIAVDPNSPLEQAYILDKSAVVNDLRYPSWGETDGRDVGLGSEPFRDPDGQPSLPELLDSTWRRVAQPHCITDNTLLPEHITQNVVTDCSVVAAIVVCLGHQRRFQSKLGISSIYPQDEGGTLVASGNGMYTVRVFVNGTWRKVKLVIDDSLPFLEDGRLLGVCAVRDKIVLWPSLLEKAYMKLMGGYAFPGSNSGADLHALVGWIPEHIHLRSSGFQMESTWNRIIEGFSKGHCVVTLGTPGHGNDISDDLIPAHDYAVMDMHDDGTEQHIALLDPWHDRNKSQTVQSLNRESVIQEHMYASRALAYSIFFHGSRVGIDTSPTALKRLRWRDSCNRFDTIHINWDPSRYSRQLHIHGLWRPRKSPLKHTQSVHNQLHVFFKSAKSQHEEVLVLITRHIVGKNDVPKFISLNVALDDGFRVINPSDRLSLQGTYSNSVHVLRRISPGKRDGGATIISSIDKADTEVGYTITILSNVDVTVDAQPPKSFYSKMLDGALMARNSGGNFTHPTFMTNPQYRLHLKSDPTGRSSAENTRSLVRFSVEGPKDLPLNLKIVWSKGQRITELVEGDVVSDTGAYSYGMAFGETELKAGEYTVIVSSFEPRQQGLFELAMHSLRAFDLEPIPAEGAGMYSKIFRGEWAHETSAGAPIFGRYHLNPMIKVFIPSMAQIIIRLQLLKPSAPIALNATVFEMNASGGFGPKTLTSGPYSDAIAGALIPRSAISPGEYLLIPSTYTSNIEAEFQILLYSTVSGVELSLRSP